MDFFKGFVPTKDKKCMMKFKNSRSEDLLEYDKVKKLPEFAGILDDDTVLIDVDDFEQSEVLFKIIEDLELPCRVYETTRGKHFMFKNVNKQIQSCKTNTNLACGLHADIKVGFRNSYSILKFKDKERKIIYDKFEDEKYCEVPRFLLPVKFIDDLFKMKSGDGRNQALYNYILALQQNGFKREDVIELYKLINKYVFSKPLEDSEIEIITRPESFKEKTFFNKGVFLFNQFAQHLRNKHNIVKINDTLHIYDDGIYVSGDSNIEYKMIEEIPMLTSSKRKEVLNYLEVLLRKNSDMSDARYIVFNNGVYDIVEDSLNEFNPDLIITNKINFNYNKNAYNELVDNLLNKLACNDKQIRNLLEEMIGYCFYRRNELRKSFILTGSKANGKSTYLDMVKTVLGEGNVSSLDVVELGDRFKTAELFGKLANIGDDIQDDYIGNPAIFKKMVSGDRVNAERKGKDPFDFNSYAKLLFSANDVPKIKDRTGAVLDRLIIIPFNNMFSKSDPDFDPYIKYKLRKPECIEYLVKLGVEGLKRVLENLSFSESDKVKEKLSEYEETNNPLILFFKE